MSDTTRIMDLPENITMQMNPTTRGDGMNTSYSPMDMHPNPYGHPPPSAASIPTPSSVPPQQMQQQMPQQMPQQTLPSRDIPQDQGSLVQDIQVQPNYVPPVPDTVRTTAEYMKQYDETTDRKIAAHKQEKESQSRMDKMVEQGQVPVLVAMLFFIFQMPIVDVYVFKYLSFMALHDTDGNFTLNGLIMRSAAFGAIFYGITYVINMLSLL
jgi:hypothetical protein